ncbi:MGMT family protein [Arthrobacter rhombi]|uniref:MGMT family protein n=1 Tax=Arthrobacter rhombi TaxID=71253 RepID=UPI003FD041CC
MDNEDAIREAVLALGPGEVASSGDIAATAGIGPRQAGRLVGKLSKEIPWWRVVHAHGSPATCHNGIAGDLLRVEGVIFRGQKVAMIRNVSHK